MSTLSVSIRDIRGLVLLALVALAGCQSQPAAAVVARVVAEEISPVPEGALRITVYPPGAPNPGRRNGRFTRDVVTPFGRLEPLIERFSLAEIDAAVRRNAAAGESDAGLYELSHHAAHLGPSHMVGPRAWELIRSRLTDEDYVWVFGKQDTGIVVLRDDQVYLLALVSHP